MESLVTCYETLCCSMNFKMHFLHSHLDPFHVSCDATRDATRVRSYSDGKHLQGRMKFRHISRLLLEGKEGCCENSVQVTDGKGLV